MDTTLVVGAGTLISKLVKYAVNYHMIGLEALRDIPASIGGAITMNAGAFGTEIGDYINHVDVLVGGKICNYTQSECAFAYRQSLFKNTDMIILGAEITLNYGNLQDIENKLELNHRMRRATQPTEPSLGSTFKKCMDGSSPAYLIDHMGLKGKRVGGAMVSIKHSGFIINTGEATSKNYLDLAEIISEQIYEKYGIILEKEIIYLKD